MRDYIIEDVLGQGGFGVVYRARHRELSTKVALKEYFPSELAIRSGIRFASAPLAISPCSKMASEGLGKRRVGS